MSLEFDTWLEGLHSVAWMEDSDAGNRCTEFTEAAVRDGEGPDVGAHHLAEQSLYMFSWAPT